MRVQRYRVRLDGRTYHPLDEVVGLGRGEASPAVRRLAAELANSVSYRDTAQVISLLTGERFTHQQVRRLVTDIAKRPPDL